SPPAILFVVRPDFLSVAAQRTDDGAPARRRTAGDFRHDMWMANDRLLSGRKLVWVEKAAASRPPRCSLGCFIPLI
ncbi:MAG TPA: hypothetical protein VIM34_06070, partial [Burkholderiaceae bacterium]